MTDARRLRDLVRAGVATYSELGIGAEVPALAWFLLSSLVPLALGLTALATVLLGDYARAQTLAARAASVLPRDVHDELVQLILRTRRDSSLLIVGSIAGMLWTASGAVGVLERCLARWLGLTRQGFVRQRLRGLRTTALVTIAIVLTVLGASAGTGIVRRLGVSPLLIRIAVPLMTAALTSLTCAVVYRWQARESVCWRSALAGGVTSGIMLQATPTATGYYLHLVAGHTPVHLFLMLSGVLFTCYAAAVGLLLGAGVTARVQMEVGFTSPSVRDPRAPG